MKYRYRQGSYLKNLLKKQNIPTMIFSTFFFEII